MTALARCAAAFLVTLGLVAPAWALTLDGDGWTITVTGPPSGWSAAPGKPGRLAFDATSLVPRPDPWAAAAQFGGVRSTTTLGWIGFTIRADPGFVVQSWNLSASDLWDAPSRHQVAHSHLAVKPQGVGGDKVRVPCTFADSIGSIGGTWSVASGPHAIGGENFSSFFEFVNTVKGPLGAIAGGPHGGPEFEVLVAQVPEPHEWARILAGLGLVGLAERRSRRVRGDADVAPA